MKENEPSLTTKRIRNSLKYSESLGHITKEQVKLLERDLGLDTAEWSEDKRNKKSIFQRFIQDWADLFESYNVVMFPNGLGITTSLMIGKGDELMAWNNIPFDSYLTDASIKRMGAGIQRQQKLWHDICTGKIKITHCNVLNSLNRIAFYDMPCYKALVELVDKSEESVTINTTTKWDVNYYNGKEYKGNPKEMIEANGEIIGSDREYVHFNALKNQ